MNVLSTRIAGPDDVHSVAMLFDAYRQFYEQKPDLVLATRFIRDRIERNESVIIIAQDAMGQVLGFCQLYPSFCSVEATPIYMLYDLFVRPVVRRTGAGTLLLLAAEKHTIQSGRTRMDLSTAKTNPSAQALYEAQGWVRDLDFHTYSKHVGASAVTP